jgi:phospholipid/cholesterol/gamma-HCH transport system substrate-binding protein
VPLELDDVYRNLDEITAALGPQGANKDGALSRLIRAGAKSLDGNGRLFNRAIRELSGALDTLAASSGDFSGTIENLATLNQTLAGKDAEIRALVRNLATISSTLNGQRSDLRTSVTSLNAALDAVARFTRDHKGALTTTIDRLTRVSGTLASETDALTELADLAPVGLVGLGNIYQPRNWDISKPEVGTIDGRTGSAAIRGDLFADLESQLSFSLSALCANLPAPQQAALAPFCSALHGAGGSLGALLQTLAASEGFVLTNPAGPTERATGLPGLLGGGR